MKTGAAPKFSCRRKFIASRIRLAEQTVNNGKSCFRARQRGLTSTLIHGLANEKPSPAACKVLDFSIANSWFDAFRMTQWRDQNGDYALWTVFSIIANSREKIVRHCDNFVPSRISWLFQRAAKIGNTNAHRRQIHLLKTRLIFHQIHKIATLR